MMTGLELALQEPSFTENAKKLAKLIKTGKFQGWGRCDGKPIYHMMLFEKAMSIIEEGLCL